MMKSRVIDVEASGKGVAVRVLLVHDLDGSLSSQCPCEPVAIDNGQTRFQGGLG